MDSSHSDLESKAAGYNQAGSRPTAGAAYTGFFHYSSTSGSVGQLSYCNGTAWFDIGKFGAAVAIDGTLADGSSTDAARADHKHSISSNTITTAMIQAEAVETAKIDDLAVTTGKIAATAVTNAKLGSDLDASKITAGTLPIARIASSAVTNVKLGSDIDAGKITAGTLPIARIATSAVTHEKIENSAGLSVIGRSANSSGVVADITAGNDNEVLLRNGTSLEFGKIDTDNITANAVDVEQMQQVAGHAILGRVGSSTANLTQIIANTDNTILGRTTGNLEFGKVTNAQLAGGITSAKIDSVDAAVLTGTIASARIGTNTVALGTQTSGNYAEEVAVSGSGLTMTGGAGQGSTFTLSHANTSSQADSTNTGNTVISNVGLDGFGHVDSLASLNLETNFYTKAEINSQLGGTPGADDTDRLLYGYSAVASRNGNAGRTIFVRGSQPNSAGALAGDIWFET
tara:strand:+ start:590 stop:1966 length:1377 start_codon:yes stop_codon:yes gene_type:complete